jgi:hypothetical protein
MLRPDVVLLCQYSGSISAVFKEKIDFVGLYLKAIQVCQFPIKPIALWSEAFQISGIVSISIISSASKNSGQPADEFYRPENKLDTSKQTLPTAFEFALLEVNVKLAADLPFSIATVNPQTKITCINMLPVHCVRRRQPRSAGERAAGFGASCFNFHMLTFQQ